MIMMSGQRTILK